MEGWGVAYATISGIVISTPYDDKIEELLLAQSESQFIIRRINGELCVSTSSDTQNVCFECGSPDFWVRNMEDFDARIDESGLACVSEFHQRRIQVKCRHCGESKSVSVKNYPEVLP